MKLKKEITFIWSDGAEREIYKPIAAEAERRGYKVRLTDDKYAKCEIGFYCQHINFPQYSKFSLIMLHDILQQFGNWPDLWLREPWDKYDIGFLPSKQWIDNWNKCSQWYYANPRIGMFQLGWPKADNYANVDKKKYREEFNNTYGLDNKKKTVLYAPAWENDNKQDDFVKAMLPLDVNILIKQGPYEPGYSPEYRRCYEEIQRMYELHKNNPRVKIIDPKTNIFEVIMASDLLVSEESSTMCEAVMMGIPAISVSNWLIPDEDPHRFPVCNYNFVFMTLKEKLTECVENLLNEYDKTLESVEIFRQKTFGPIGGCAKIVMDIIDDCVDGNEIRYTTLKPAEHRMVPIKQNCFHIMEGMKRELYHNYNQRYKFVHAIYEPMRRLKKKIEGKL